MCFDEFSLFTDILCETLKKPFINFKNHSVTESKDTTLLPEVLKTQYNFSFSCCLNTCLFIKKISSNKESFNLDMDPILEIAYQDM